MFCILEEPIEIVDLDSYTKRKIRSDLEDDSESEILSETSPIPY